MAKKKGINDCVTLGDFVKLIQDNKDEKAPLSPMVKALLRQYYNKLPDKK